MESPSEPHYAPLSETARLYAGWLLAWYAVVFLASGYRATGLLPLDVSWLEGIYRSPLVVLCAFGTFFFLLLSDFHRMWGGRALSAVALAVLWLGGVTAFGYLG